MNADGYDIEEKSWVVSEVKATLIKIHSVYVETRAEYMRSLSGFNHKKNSRVNYIVTIDAYYSFLRKGFIPYLKKQEEVYKLITEKDYDLLYFKEKSFDDQKLLLMGSLLNNYNFEEGFFNITHQNKVFSDPVAMLEYYNQE